MSRRYAASDEDRTTLAVYLREISTLPRLTVDEEHELAVRIRRDRNEADIARLIEANLRFVVSYAKRYRGFGVSLLDLIHAGNLGLLEAARRFDPARNVKFITYGVWWIRQAMVQLLAGQTRAFSFPPRLVGAMASGMNDVSLSDPVSADSHRELADLIEDDAHPVDLEMIHQSDLDELASALHALEGKELQVLQLRFGLEDEEPRTLEEIGRTLRLSRERVRQIEWRAKEKLRRATTHSRQAG